MEYNELILDMLNRIVKLEKEVELLKNEKTSSEVIPKETFVEERPIKRDICLMETCTLKTNLF